MTTLIAVQTVDDVELGWDSQMTRANEVSQQVAPKMFVNNGVIYGVAGLNRARDVMETANFPDYDGSDPRLWLIREWVPNAKALLEENPALADEEGSVEFSVLMVVGGQVFQMDSLFNPTQSTVGIYTMGSGGDYARGALFAGATLMDALHVAADIDPYTGGALTVCKASKFLEAQA